MKELLTTRVATDADKGDILGLLNLVFTDQQRSDIERGDEFWNWKYKQNPFGESTVHIVEDDGSIVAVDNLWPWNFECRGQIVRALQPCDSVVHPDYRGKGIFKNTRVKGVNFARENNIDLIFNFPNDNSLNTSISLGYNFLGKIKWWVKILKPVNLISQQLFSTKSKPYHFDEEYHVDASLLDEIHEESKCFDRFLNVHRIDGFHEWRYVSKPNRKYGMVVYEEGRKRSAGIFTINQKGSGKEFVIVDFIGDTNTTEGLIRRLVEVTKKLDADFIATMHNPQFFKKNLYKFGFFRKKLKNMVVLPLNISLEEKVQAFSGFSLVAGMHDSI